MLPVLPFLQMFTSGLFMGFWKAANKDSEEDCQMTLFQIERKCKVLEAKEAGLIQWHKQWSPEQLHFHQVLYCSQFSAPDQRLN